MSCLLLQDEGYIRFGLQKTISPGALPSVVFLTVCCVSAHLASRPPSELTFDTTLFIEKPAGLNQRPCFSPSKKAATARQGWSGDGSPSTKPHMSPCGPVPVIEIVM